VPIIVSWFRNSYRGLDRPAGWHFPAGTEENYKTLHTREDLRQIFEQDVSEM
jgi:hypothetical protein